MTIKQNGFEATNLGFSYDGRAILKDINLKINQGEFVCLLGESGSGKTTLLNLLAGLTKPSEGHVYWKGKEIEKPSAERSVVFQDYTLFPWLTFLQNVTLAIKKTRLSTAALLVIEVLLACLKKSMVQLLAESDFE